MSAATALEIQSPGDAPAQAPAAMTPMDMLNRALASGASMDVLEKLLTLQERWEKGQARKAFDAALSSAKAEIPVIAKNRTVDFTSSKGRTNYRHEDLGEIARTVDPILARHGLSYRFRPAQEINGPVTVTCILSHRDGHSEEFTLMAGRDDSGNKNSIQAVGSTVTYLQRYTLKMALGLAAAADDDAKSSGTDDGPVSEEQAGAIRKLIEDGGADISLFCQKWQIGSVPELPASKFEEAKTSLERWIANIKKQREARG